MRTRRPSTLLAMICLIPVVGGCSGGSGPEIPTGLTGTWRWVEASGGIAGVTITPESSGQSMTVVLGADGLARLYGSDVPDRVVHYEVVERTTVSEPVWDIFYDEPLLGFDSQIATQPATDVLLLFDPCCDGFTWRFERVL